MHIWYFCRLFMLMGKFATGLIGIIFVFGLLSCASNANRPERATANTEPPALDLDSLFALPDYEQIELKATEVDAVFQRLRRITGFNGAVLYAEQGRVVYKNAFGYKDVRRRRDALQPGDQFELASVSKMFTAMAIMVLHSDGSIPHYDIDVRAFIPEWPYEDVTIRQLLNHRSGLSRYESLAHEQWKDKTIPLTNDRMIDLFVQYKPAPYFKPNRGFHYCNTNYALLASVVERVSGMYFEDFLKNRIFDPLGMKDSFIYSMRSDTVVSAYKPFGVPGHDLRGRRYITVRNYYLNGVMGDKSMVSTVDDLYRFDKALNYGLLVHDTILRVAFEAGSPRQRVDNYGFGWRIKTASDSAVYHYGWWKGFRSFYLRDMAQKKTLIVLTNTDKGPGAEHFWNFLNDQSVELFPASANVSFEMGHELW